jgi:SnoaL-like domain
MPIERWPLEPLERSRRGLDERIRMAAPGVSQRLGRRLMEQPPGAPMRRRVLSQTMRVSMAAINRDDYESPAAGIHPEAVLQPPGKGQGGLDFDAEYHGPEGFKRFITQWKSGFDYFRYEPREIADAGGAHFALKVGVFGRFAGSGTELEDEWSTVYTLKDGMAYRMVNEYEWENALAALEGRLAGSLR